jgi:hypothetical protein
MITLFAVLALSALLQGAYEVRAASVTLIEDAQGWTCSGNLCSDCSELKLEGNDLREGTFSDGVLEVTISNVVYKEGDEMMSFNWSSNLGVDAVLVKAGTSANLYQYDPEAISDTNLIPPGQQAISHISFCYDEEVANPAIDIEKSTNGEDADNAPGPYVEVGDSVTWTYVVTNIGGVALSTISVADDQPGVTPVYQGGDTDNDGELDTDETWTYQANGTATAGQYENVGTATGSYGGQPYTG